MLKTKADGVARGLKSASAWRRRRGLRGQAKLYHQAYCYIKTRTPWMRYHSYQRQRLPRGSGITEAACKVVFTQRLKRSGTSWTIAGGQVSLDLRVIRLSGVWDAVHQRYSPGNRFQSHVTHGQGHSTSAISGIGGWKWRYHTRSYFVWPYSWR